MMYYGTCCNPHEISGLNLPAVPHPWAGLSTRCITGGKGEISGLNLPAVPYPWAGLCTRCITGGKDEISGLNLPAVPHPWGGLSTRYIIGSKGQLTSANVGTSTSGNTTWEMILPPLFRKCRNLNVSQPYVPPGPVTEMVYLSLSALPPQ
jgi:hypothetical protein